MSDAQSSCGDPRATHVASGQLRSGVITQLDVLASELGSLALRERICSIQDVVEQREGRFYLQMMGSTAAASRFLIELPYPLRWQDLKRQAFSCRPGDEL